MCGIAGFVSFGAVPTGEREALHRTALAMQVRGPDGSGSWFAEDGRVGLAHRRLAIIDLSPAGTQPMLDRSGELVISFNGEIYNYRELRERLVADGATFASATDTEVILELYRRHGVGVTSYLRGMYAFAIWDVRQRRLFLARDPFGMKPLYWSNAGGVFRFASQVKALLGGGRVSSEPGAEGTTGFLLWGSVPEPFTLYREIAALKAGTAMTVTADGSIDVHAFATLPPAAAPPSDPASALAAAVRDSVRSHLVADVPIGLFLSSGIDSAVLAAHASACSDMPLRSVTVGFEEFRGTDADETEPAARLAERYGLRHQTLWIGRRDFEACFDHILAAMDQPTIDGVNSYFVSRAAASAGLKVALSGIGGDELFGGYPSFRQVPSIVRATRWLGRSPRIGAAARRAILALRPTGLSPKYAGLFELGPSISGAYWLRRALFLPWELRDALAPELVAEGLAGLSTSVCLDKLVEGAVTPFEAVSRLEVGQYMRNQLLRDADWAGMAHSLEIRLPFVDVELWRLVVSMQRAGHAYRKPDLAATVVPPLPAEVVARRKTGFRTPTWRRHTATGEAVADVTDWRGWALQLLAHTA